MKTDALVAASTEARRTRMKSHTEARRRESWRGGGGRAGRGAAGGCSVRTSSRESRLFGGALCADASCRLSGTGLEDAAESGERTGKGPTSPRPPPPPPPTVSQVYWIGAEIWLEWLLLAQWEEEVGGGTMAR
ncbi:hypothetical protein L1887_53648 [Cichorium endivia]|nr:hypothetical protein L1887_53648 [Cichorium endivia]